MVKGEIKVIDTSILTTWLREQTYALESLIKDIDTNKEDIHALISVLKNDEITRIERQVEWEQTKLLEKVVSLLSTQLQTQLHEEITARIDKDIYIRFKHYLIARFSVGRKEIEFYRYEIDHDFIKGHLIAIRDIYEDLSLHPHEKSIAEMIKYEWKSFVQKWTKATNASPHTVVAHDSPIAIFTSFLSSLFFIITKLDKARIRWKEDFEEKERKLATLERELKIFQYEAPRIKQRIEEMSAKVRKWFEVKGYVTRESKEVLKIG
jgi:hypothetical protein